MKERDYYLLQVNDALFPIGGYSHSRAAGGVENSGGAAGSSPENGLPFCENHRKAGAFCLRDRNLSGISGKAKGEDSEPLLYLWRILRLSGYRGRGMSVPLSVCADLCHGNELRENRSPEPECGAEAAGRLFPGI